MVIAISASYRLIYPLAFRIVILSEFQTTYLPILLALRLGKPPRDWSIVVLIIFLLGVGLLIFKTLKLWLPPTTMKEQILQEAEINCYFHQAGGDFRNVIIHCYLQMTNAL